MPLNLQDIIKLGLVGSGGGSSGGGGGGSAPAVSPKEVNFYDYDGTCVHAYTVAEAQALSELPAGPEHPGLVFQGWNWSLEGVKGLTRAMNIGAMYTTDDGTTRLYITLQEGRTSPMLGVGVDGTVTVDWGDGTEPDVLTGTGITGAKWTPAHKYAAPGDYVIRLSVNGEMAFLGSSYDNQYAYILRNGTSTDVRNGVYQAALKRVEIGDNVTSISSDAFNQCRALESICVPRSVTSISQRILYNNDAINTFIIPESVTTIASKCFYSGGVKKVIAPENLTEVGQGAFTYCSSLTSFIMPDGVTKISDNAFSSCMALASMVIPGGVKSILASTFSYCNGVAYYDFTACTAVPTLANTNAFNSIPDDCEIRVPAALYDEWIAATNWATYASKIKAY